MAPEQRTKRLGSWARSRNRVAFDT